MLPGQKFRSRSHDAVIRVYDEAGNVIETHEHAGDFKVLTAGCMTVVYLRVTPYKIEW
jgi:hypothetical protein